MNKEIMVYKEYIATLHYSAEDEVFYGMVEGINDLVSFEGKSVDELKDSFAEAIEDYIENCKSAGREPERTFKGSFNIRITPELHKKAFETAKRRMISLNRLVQKAIEREIDL